MPKKSKEPRSIKIGKLTLVFKGDMTIEQWQQYRTKGIGGSDVSTILDLNPYYSITELFYEKIGYRPAADLSDNENVFWGSNLEDKITEVSQYFDMSDPERKNYLHNHKKGVKKRKHFDLPYLVHHEDYPWLIANVDGIAVDADEELDQEGFIAAIEELGQIFIPENIVEVKTMTIYTSDKYDGNVPTGYIAQVMTYMIPFIHLNPDLSAIIFALKAGIELEAFPIPFMDSMATTIVTECEDFYARMVAGKKLIAEATDVMELEAALDEIAPRPKEGNDSYSAFLSKRIQERADNTMKGGHEQLQLGYLYKELNTHKRDYSDQVKAVSMRIKEYMDIEKVSVLDFGENGRISFNKRLYVNVKS